MSDQFHRGQLLCLCGVRWSQPMSQHCSGVDVEHGLLGGEQLSVWHPLTWRERFRMLPVVHDLWFVLTYYTGIRDRLRCPKCRAVGTWKMHGSLLERWVWKDIHVRRWLCKWCGHYTGPRGRVVAYMDESSRTWAIPVEGVPRGHTPLEAVTKDMGRVWPWYG